LGRLFSVVLSEQISKVAQVNSAYSAFPTLKMLEVSKSTNQASEASTLIITNPAMEYVLA